MGTARDAHDYRFEHGSLSTVLNLGESWEFLGGAGQDGHEHYIEMTIEPMRRFKLTTRRKIIYRPVPIEFNYETIAHRLRELAFLTKGLEIFVEDERTGEKETFHYEGGIEEFVRFLNEGRNLLHPDPEIPIRLARFTVHL